MSAAFNIKSALMDGGSFSFKDALAGLGLEGMVESGSINIGTILISLLLSLAVGSFIFLIYKRTYNGVLYSRSFNVSLIILTLVTTLIIRTITANLTLSLGMVGALSIVRFRTAVKDPMDTVYMFWAVAAGIAMGAGYYGISLVGTLGIGLIIFLISLIKNKGSMPYLLIIRHDYASTNDVNFLLKKLPRGSRLKSKTVTRNGVEITMEVRLLGENTPLINEFLSINGVYDATLVSYQGDYGA